MKDKRRRTVLTTNDIIKMREFRKEGLSNKQIAARMGIGISTVYDHIGKKSLDVKSTNKEEKNMSKVDLKPISTGDIATMRKLREEGLTNKKIAERMGISISSVYRYIGRKSQDVKYAEIQNKPSPVKTEFKIDSSSLMVVHDIDIPKKEVVEEIKEEKPDVVEVKTENTIDIPKEEGIEEEKPAVVEAKIENTIDIPVEEKKEEDVVVESTNLLQVLSTRMELKGSLCNFTVDSKSGTIEMSDGVMSGILDRDTVIRFIAELSEASKYIIKEDHN